MNERRLINFERMANNQPLLYPPLNEQEVKQHKLNERINQSRSGGGDFTTAKVILDFTENFRPSAALVSAGTYRIGFVYLYDGEGFATLVCDDSDNFHPDGGSLETDIDVPLYKGSAFFPITFLSGFQSDYISFDGSVEVFGEGLLITGDCTITLSGASGGTTV